jgi:Nucleotidyl transferase AbiEii toxin, Type IV TA system
MRVFTPHTTILPLEQQLIWSSLAPLKSLGFVLYGGTAIALRIGHRPSVDFDFFTDEPLQQKLILRHASFIAQAQTLQDAPDTWTVLVSVYGVPSSANPTGLVKVSFFGGIDVGRVGEPETTQDGVLTAASLDDLLAYKLKVMLQRVEAKDYRDVAALLRSGIALERGLAGASTLFGPNFQPAESLRALTYFSGGDLATLDQADRAILQSSVVEIDLGISLPSMPRLSLTLT